jgi:hypothetical protein
MDYLNRSRRRLVRTEHYRLLLTFVSGLALASLCWLLFSPPERESLPRQLRALPPPEAGRELWAHPPGMPPPFGVLKESLPRQLGALQLPPMPNPLLPKKIEEEPLFPEAAGDPPLPGAAEAPPSPGVAAEPLLPEAAGDPPLPGAAEAPPSPGVAAEPLLTEALADELTSQ